MKIIEKNYIPFYTTYSSYQYIVEYKDHYYTRKSIYTWYHHPSGGNVWNNKLLDELNENFKTILREEKLKRILNIEEKYERYIF